MGSQNGCALRLVGERNFHLAVETARSQERRIQYLRTIGGRHHHDAGGWVETIHFGQKLIEGLLALVVGENRSPASLTNGVDLVDEDD